MFAMAHRPRSGKPWELIAWCRKRSRAEASIRLTRQQEKLLGRGRTQVRVFTEAMWVKMTASDPH